MRIPFLAVLPLLAAKARVTGSRVVPTAYVARTERKHLCRNIIILSAVLLKQVRRLHTSLLAACSSNLSDAFVQPRDVQAKIGIYKEVWAKKVC